MNIKYNNIDKEQAHNLVTFSDVPNILEITDTTAGTKAVLQLTVESGWSATGNNEYWITFMDNTISNVTDFQNANNKNFFISSDRHSTGVSIANALRNCPSVTASFLIYCDGYNVTLKAREIGAIDLSVTMSENLSYLTTATTAGTSVSLLTNNKIYIDVKTDGEYVTSLEKYYHGGKCSFDMTPVLATMTEYNKTIPYSLKVSRIQPNGEVITMGNITGNSASVGYMVNQGDKFLTISDNIFIGQNTARGKLRDVYNSSLLYVSADAEDIPISFYTTSDNDVTATTFYRDSAYNTITSTTQSIALTGDILLHTATIDLDIPANCFYVDVQLNNLQKLRYDVIRPMKTSYGCQRIYWINSYGGTSFIDLVGQKAIENTSETMTYNKNVLEYYTSEFNEKEIVYDVITKTNYTLKSHLIAEDGQWQFYDLLQSPRAWTNINGEDYLIIVDSVSSAEQNNNGVYEMTVKFHISQPTSL